MELKFHGCKIFFADFVLPGAAIFGDKICKKSFNHEIFSSFLIKNELYTRGLWMPPKLDL